jgi:hypothetical protein
MELITASAERTIPAPAGKVYALLADYETGHPTILPDAFSGLEVLEGGVGAGTVIRFRVRLLGRVRAVTARIAEPEPGRVLTETDVETGAVTKFTVDPRGGDSRLRIETSWEARGGIAGFLERMLAPRLLRRLYEEELDLVERWAARSSP